MQQSDNRFRVLKRQSFNEVKLFLHVRKQLACMHIEAVLVIGGRFSFCWSIDYMSREFFRDKPREECNKLLNLFAKLIVMIVGIYPMANI